MELRQRKCYSFLWKQMCVWLIFLCLGVMVDEVAGGKNCPVKDSTFYAYPEGKSYYFSYTFKPFLETNIDLLDRFLTSDKKVTCEWKVRAKADHTAYIEIHYFYLKQSSGGKHGDCLKIYDGATRESGLLGELCGGDITGNETKTFSASGREMLVEYLQGEITGYRTFKMMYSAKPKAKEMLLKIAGIVCGSVAGLGLIYLVFKFSRSCRPCRKRCCPDQEQGEGTRQQQVPLTPTPQGSSANAGGDGGGGRGGGGGSNVQGGATLAYTSEPRRLGATRSGGGEGGEEDEGEEDFALPEDEPPPSYDSIFNTVDDQNKPN